MQKTSRSLSMGHIDALRNALKTTPVPTLVPGTLTQVTTPVPVPLTGPYVFGNTGFLTSYPKELRQRILASEFIVIDAETTGLTPNAKPVAVGTSARIGSDATLTKYRSLAKAAGFEITLDCRLRMRIWSFQLDDGTKHAVDLDALSGADVRQLLTDTVHEKVIIGHNLAFDLTWVLHTTGDRNIKPALILDTMLIARCLKPASVYAVHRLAVNDPVAQKIIAGGTNASVALGALGYGMGLLEADKTWQHPRNWVLSHLCRGHFEYVMDDVDAPLLMLQHWTASKGQPFSTTLAALRTMDAMRGDSYFNIYAKVPLSLALISGTGMPLHMPTVNRVRELRGADLERLVEDVISKMPTVGDLIDNEGAFADESKQEFLDLIADMLCPAPSKPKGKAALAKCEPETAEEVRERRETALTKHRSVRAFELFRKKLEARASAVLAPMKKILAVYADMHDCTLDVNEDGHPVINAKAAKLKGATKLEAWKAWEALQTNKKLLALCDEYEGIASGAGDMRRLHPLLSARTATGRVASQTPNVMNLPRPLPMPESWLPDQAPAVRVDAWNAVQFRAVVCAPIGYTLISADYGQIELRIAAALALRAIEDAQKALRGELEVPSSKRWFMDALRRGQNPDEVIPADDEIEDDFEKFSSNISRLWRRLITQPQRPLADAFRANVDPHLLTGVTLAARQGLLDFGGMHPIEFLKAQDSATLKTFKKIYGPQRQSAKALNFGLLYGMQAEKLWVHGLVDYNLAWTLEESTDARTAWFDLFPEIAFLQIWHQMMLMPSKKAAEKMYRKNPYSKKLQVEDVRVGAARTLRGRPVCATEAREILNYSDQGSGADMLLQAVTWLMDNARDTFDCVIDLIHDEVLMCVPLDRLEEHTRNLEGAMTAAADFVLAPWGIPSEAEGAQMPFWRKD